IILLGQSRENNAITIAGRSIDALASALALVMCPVAGVGGVCAFAAIVQQRLFSALARARRAALEELDLQAFSLAPAHRRRIIVVRGAHGGSWRTSLHGPTQDDP